MQEALAVVLPPSDGSSMAQLATFSVTKSGWLTNVSENVFTAIKKDFPKLMWTVKSDDENLAWFFDRADGSLRHDEEVMFWTGIDSGTEVKALMRDFTAPDRINLESKIQEAASAASGMYSSMSGRFQQARAFSTKAGTPVRHPDPALFIYKAQNCVA